MLDHADDDVSAAADGEEEEMFTELELGEGEDVVMVAVLLELLLDASELLEFAGTSKLVETGAWGAPAAPADSPAQRSRREDGPALRMDLDAGGELSVM